jgi:hypothetical protein
MGLNLRVLRIPFILFYYPFLELIIDLIFKFFLKNQLFLCLWMVDVLTALYLIYRYATYYWLSTKRARVVMSKHSTQEFFILILLHIYLYSDL